MGVDISMFPVVGGTHFALDITVEQNNLGFPKFFLTCLANLPN